MPQINDVLWTVAKGMYKVEPIIVEGDEVVIYALRFHEVSFTHGKLVDQIGYHCRDYYLALWEKFRSYPGGVLAHSTHLKGLGTFDCNNEIDTTRISVTLATRIPAERCKKINLGYLSPKESVVEEWQNREDDGILVFHQPGEMLYRIK